MEEITLTREELLEFAKMATFHLDDRLCPFSREDLRAEAWIVGYQFAKRHQKQHEEDENNLAPMPADFEEQLEQAYKNADEVQYQNGYREGQKATVEEINEALLSEVLPCFMHGGEADEVVAKLEEVLSKKVKDVGV